MENLNDIEITDYEDSHPGWSTLLEAILPEEEPEDFERFDGLG